MNRRERLGLLAFGLLVGAAAAGLFAWRIAEWSAADPWSDQYFQIDWVRTLLLTDHWLPRLAGPESWLAALKTDEGSALHVLLAHLHAAHNLILTTVSVAWFSLWGMVFGGTADAQAAIGIATHGLMVLALAWMPVLCGYGASRTERMAVGGLAFIGAVGSPTLQAAATLGFHNLALFLMVAALIAGERWLDGLGRADGGRAPIFLAVQTAALYAYFTNVFFVPSAVLLTLLVKRRRVEALRYALATAATLLPLPVLLAVSRLERGGAGTNQDFLGSIALAFWSGDPGAGGPLARAVEWFPHVATLLSPAGLALGIAGVCGLAMVHGRFLPLTLLVAHWLAGVLVPEFHHQWERTVLYVLPILCLGMAWALVAAFRSFAAGRPAVGRTAVALALAVVGLAAVHAWGEGDGWLNPRGPARHFLADRQDRPWRRLVAAMDVRLPPGAVIIPNDYQGFYRVRALSDRVRRDLRVFRPLDVLNARQEAGTLSAYLAERHLAVVRGTPVFVLATGPDPRERLEGKLTGILGDGGVRWVVPGGRLVTAPVNWTDGLLPPPWTRVPLRRICELPPGCTAERDDGH